MKPVLHQSRKIVKAEAFTLVEVMIAVSIFMFVLVGVLAATLYGLKMSKVSEIRLNASEDARQTLSRMIADVRSANSLKVGSGSLTNFTEVADGTNQIGNAVQIYVGSSTNMGVNTNDWVRYFYNAAKNTLERTEDGVTSSLVTANCITNDYSLFVLENNNFVTNLTKQAVAVLSVNLNFTKLNNPLVPIGPGNQIEFYTLHAMLSPRVRP